jgi:hypothetical protein
MGPAEHATRTADASALDAHRVRADFPIFERLVHGKPLAYLDSANSSQKPRAMLDAMLRFYETSYANVHRGVYTIGQEATAAFEGTRDVVRAFLNAPTRREIIFTRDATEALNLVAYSYGRSVCGPGDVIVATELEHHSNLVPWQVLAEATGATLRYLRIDDAGELQLDALDEIARISAGQYLFTRAREGGSSGRDRKRSRDLCEPLVAEELVHRGQVPQLHVRKDRALDSAGRWHLRSSRVASVGVGAVCPCSSERCCSRAQPQAARSSRPAAPAARPYRPPGRRRRFGSGRRSSRRRATRPTSSPSLERRRGQVSRRRSPRRPRSSSTGARAPSSGRSASTFGCRSPRPRRS